MLSRSLNAVCAHSRENKRHSSTLHSLRLILIPLLLTSTSIDGRDIHRREERRIEEQKVFRIPLRRSEGLVDEAVVAINPIRRRAANENAPGGVRSADMGGQQGHELRGKPGQGYYIEMGIGEPPQMVNVLIDTGSSNFAVAAAPHPDIDRYFNTSASQTLELLGSKVAVPYTQGEWTGMLGRDSVLLAHPSPPLTPPLTPSVSPPLRADLALITGSTSFFINGSQWQGILGLAYRAISRPDESVEPLLDALVRQMRIDDVFSLQLCGTGGATDRTARMAGSLIIGGSDTRMYRGSLVYVPLRREWYYDVVIVDVLVGGVSLGLDCKEYNFDKSIVDSGTTNLRLPTRVYNGLLRRLKETIRIPNAFPDDFWRGVTLVCWANGTTPWGAFPSLTLRLVASVNSTISLAMPAQRYLRYIVDELGLTRDKDCYRFSVAPSDSGSVLGAVFMENFYVVFDRRSRRIGFAESSCSPPQPTGSPAIAGPHFTAVDTSDCAYQRPDDTSRGRSGLNTALYVMAGVCALCLVPAVLILGRRALRRWYLDPPGGGSVSARCRPDVDDLLER